MLKRLYILICCLVIFHFLENRSSFTALTNFSTIAKITNNPENLSTSRNQLAVHSVASRSSSVECESCRRILIQGGLHGDEIYTTEFVDWLRIRIAAGRSQINRVPENLIFDFLPKANPDQFGKTRLNTRGINLNRNFGYFWGVSKEPHGDYPFSEAETKAISELAKNRRYFAAFDIHGYARWLVTPSMARGSISQAKISRYNKWIEILQNRAAVDLNYGILKAVELGDGGAFEDWMFWGQNTFATCIELNNIVESGFKVDREKEYLKYETFIFNTLMDTIQAFDQDKNHLKGGDKLTLK